jgi:VWFA-related protein
MKRVRNIALAVTICMCGMAVTSVGQVSSTGISALVRVPNWNSTEPSSSDIFTMRHRVEEVSVRFAAFDAKGQPVEGLSAADLQLFDDRKAVPNFKSFSKAQQQPMLLGVVVDLSDSIPREQQSEILDILEALPRVLDPATDKAFLVGFSNQVRLMQPPTADLALIRETLRERPRQVGLTSLYDAVVATCRDDYEGGAGQRIMLLFSDGADNLSMHGIDDAVEAALHAGIAIFAISTATTGTEGKTNLQTLAQRTGGRAYFIRKKHEVRTAIAELTHAMLDQYVATFRPATERAGFHNIRLEPKSGKTISFVGYRGYYLDPE